jgi:hypothetical protein
MGAIGLNGASAEVDDSSQRTRVANAGWSKWTPVNMAAIAAHVVGAAGLALGNKGRLAAQSGTATTSLVKAGLTAAALGATAYSRVLGQKVMNAGDVPSEGGTSPAGVTPEDVAAAQKQLDALQWAIPALTGVLLVLNAKMGEQQRPRSQARGILGRLRPG